MEPNICGREVSLQNKPDTSALQSKRRHLKVVSPLILVLVEMSNQQQALGSNKEQQRQYDKLLIFAGE